MLGATGSTGGDGTARKRTSMLEGGAGHMGAAGVGVGTAAGSANDCCGSATGMRGERHGPVGDITILFSLSDESLGALKTAWAV